MSTISTQHHPALALTLHHHRRITPITPPQPSTLWHEQSALFIDHTDVNNISPTSPRPCSNPTSSPPQPSTTSTLWHEQSALCIDHMDTNNTTVVDIDLDISARLANISTLATNVERRGLGIDLNRLVSG